MRAGGAAAALAAFLAIGACGQDSRQGETAAEASRASRPAAGGGLPASLDSSLAAQGLHLDDSGRVSTHAAAGFEVYWPSGCARLQTGEPEVVDPTVRQEFRYACDRFGKEGRGCSVYVLQNGQDENGGPPSPTMVVDLVEGVLEHYGVRAERQRPLAAAGVEGIDVQAVQPAGRGEVWVRGLLAGPHVYVLTAWSMDGGLFSDTETVDFFASFRLIQ